MDRPVAGASESNSTSCRVPRATTSCAASARRSWAGSSEWDLAERYWDALIGRRCRRGWRNWPCRSNRMSGITCGRSSVRRRTSCWKAGKVRAVSLRALRVARQVSGVAAGAGTGSGVFQGVAARLAGAVGEKARCRHQETAPGRRRKMAGICHCRFRLRPARRNRIRLAEQLGPSRPEEFSEAWQPFFARLADPKTGLTKEAAALTAAQGRWPRYPRMLLVLALRHNLKVPEGAALTLPGNSLRRGCGTMSSLTARSGRWSATWCCGRSPTAS